MAKNKVLYVKDEDALIWDKAKKLLSSRGESLSSHITKYLKHLVKGKK